MLIQLLNSELTTEIDDCDSHLSNHQWRVVRKPPSKTTYAGATIGGKLEMLHRLILCPPPGFKTDHKDGNGLNNKRENLRQATQSQNMANTGLLKNNTSGFKGVQFIPKKNLWRAYITINGKRPYIGSFKLKEDAAKAYDAAALKYFGEFARLNFPEKNPKKIQKNFQETDSFTGG